MSFLFPLFLLGTAAVAIPIVLHLMKRERLPPLPFSDLRFLRRTATVVRRRRRLRELLLLALRVMAVTLLAFAFARPYADPGADASAATVVVVDRSFSMGAPGTMDEARGLANSAITEAPTDHAVGVVVFDTMADVAQGLTTDRGAAQTAIKDLTAGHRRTRFASGLAAARDLIGTRSGRIVLVTDRQATGWQPETSVAVPRGIDIDVQTVRAVDENVAVTAVEVDDLTIRVVLTSTGPPRSVAVGMAVDDAPVASTIAEVSGSTTTLALDLDLGGVAAGDRLARAVVTVSVDDPVGLVADNRRRVRVGAVDAASPRVGVVGGFDLSVDGAYFLRHALLAGDQEVPFVVDVFTPDDLTVRDLSEMAALIVVDTGGLHRRSRAAIARFVRQGGGLLVVCGPGIDPMLLADLFGSNEFVETNAVAGAAPIGLAVTDARHPIFLELGTLGGALGEVRVNRSLRVIENDTMGVLVRFGNGSPALVELASPTGRMLLFASDLNNEWNDFPRREAFAPFVRELARYLVAESTVVETEPTLENADLAESDLTRETPATFRDHLVEGVPSDIVDLPSRPNRDASETEQTQSYWWYALVALAVVLIGEAALGRLAV